MFGLRPFSLLSLLIIAALAAATGFGVRTLASQEMVRLVENQNVSVAQSYVNTVWKKERDAIVPLTQSGDLSQLRTNQKVLQFAQDTEQFFQRIPLWRANIYTGTGALLMTVGIDNAHTLPENAASPDRTFVAGHIGNSFTSSNLIESAAFQDGTHSTLVQTLIPIFSTAGNRAGMMEVLTDSSAAWHNLTLAAYYSAGGVALLCLMLLVTMTLALSRSENIIARQHEANIELQATADAAKAENQEKSQFLANVSHELRTPLNAIIGFSDIIKTEVIAPLEDKKYHTYIGDIHASGVHLLSLINDILDYSKAEAGKLELEASEVNANRVVQNCLRLVQPRAELGEVKLVEAMPKEQLTLINDGKKFKQILLNLLSNAVKFTPPGGQVSVMAWRNIEGDTISFQVQDSGIGIAPKDISRAMSPFGQIDNTLKRKYEGTGLGLPLTKKFVELMGGKFIIESELGVGTKITFTLPREIQQREGIIIKHVLS